jgi:hypothetical protein
MKIKIDKNIPIPSRAKNPFIKIIDEIEVGDSFLMEADGKGENYEADLKRQVRRIISSFSQKRIADNDYKTRVAQRQLTLENGRLAFRIWRVE